uniref:C2H2-type domain-containing protein n=1 Tax=Anopheles epiroticus TaxID=199890 RepID=A0A182P534_9DIPT
MAFAVPLEFAKICRFCLCEEEGKLIPIEKLQDFEVTIEDIVRFTGIQINDSNKASYAVCSECTNKLKTSAAFRSFCLQNDTLFHDLCVMLVTSGQETHYEFDGTVAWTESSNILPHNGMVCGVLNPPPEAIHLNDLFKKPEPTVEVFALSEAPMQTTNVLNDNENIQHSHTFSTTSTVEELIFDNDELFAYSANSTIPGEILFDDDVLWDSPCFLDWEDSFNPPPPPDVPYVYVKGKRKQHLCDICGIMVGHVRRHYMNHSEEPLYACPHCPVKMKQKANIAQHIQQVHLKQPTKTCEVCGKGFVHHKTYRYHMLSHEGEGKTFECQDCLKTFTNAIYLRDHINRLHNVARPERIQKPRR